VVDDLNGVGTDDGRFTLFSDINMKALHSMIPGGGSVADGSRARIVAEHEKNLEGLQRIIIDPTVRRRTLFVLSSVAPYYLERLNTKDRASYLNGLVNDASALNREGFNAMTLGLNYVSADFVDFKHHSDAAAPKMAEDVAVKLRAMVQRDNGEASK
jgi:hypothetical protein